jgi:hypothetical protein
VLYEAARVQELVTRAFVDDEALSRDGAGQTAVALEPPGAWFEAVDGCWLPTGRGRPWVIREPVGRHGLTLQE